MYAIVTYENQGDNLLINIRQKKSIVYKIALSIITILILPTAVLCFFILLINERSAIQTVTALGACIILLIFVYKHLRAVFGREIISINNNVMSYTASFLGIGKYIEFNMKDIKRIKHVGCVKYFKNDLEISGDALGFGTSQGEINYLNQEGTILIMGSFGNIRFGINVDSEDANAIIYKIKKAL